MGAEISKLASEKSEIAGQVGNAKDERDGLTQDAERIRREKRLASVACRN